MTGQELSELIFQLRCNCISRDESIRDECNLSPVEFRALTSLSKNDRVSATVFAEKLELSPSRVSRVIDRMVQTGLIAVEANATDRRGVFIALTETGSAQKEIIEQSRQRCNDKIESVFSEADREEIGGSLQKLLSLL